MNQLLEYKSRFRILKGGKVSMVVSALLAGVTISYAAPSGGVVTSGNANISQSGNTTNINQSTHKATINWNKFNIAQNETVNFNQPNASSITLNRVIGNERSVINGALNANGQVWILNSNGVLFGKNASINTAGLLATTAKLSDNDFNKGNYNFKNSSSNSVINLGTINISNEAYAVLAGKEVTNEGSIKAVKGKIHLVGADEYSINLNGNSLLNLTVKKGILDSIVKNSGSIKADAGEIYLTTNAVNELLKGVVNNTGVIEANSMGELTGKVELFAHGGKAEVGGSISATDGFVETSGKDFKILDNAIIKAGEWLIDPVDITIDATLASTIQTALGNGDVTIETTSAGGNTPDTSSGESAGDGDITVNSGITWSTNKKLTLKADDDIFINSTISAKSGGQLALYYGQGSNNGGNSDYHINAPVNLSAGDNFFTKKGSAGSETTWTVITELGNAGSTTKTDLQGINGNLSGHYVLGANIDASVTKTDTANWGTEGFNPIGDISNRFTGNFDGLGHTIDKLYINRPTQDYIGLFAYTKNSTIQNIGLTNIDITGKDYVGGLVGNIYTNNGTSTIKNSYASGSVKGGAAVGGLVGKIYANNGTSTISNSYASGSVFGEDKYTIMSPSIGGLVGAIVLINGYSTISDSYASNSVSGKISKGGLVGRNEDSTISNSYYDKQTNADTSMQDKDTYGKTKAEISSLITGDKWSTNGTKAKGYVEGTTELPFLISVSKLDNRLFEDGFGTDANPYTLTNWTQLQNINFNTTTLGANYNLSNDLTESMDDYANIASQTANGGKGFNLIGDDSTRNNNSRFTGSFDGLGHTIDKLFINRPGQTNVGLFGVIENSTIQNIGLTNINITGKTFVGGLVGVNFIDNGTSTISNSYATGSVTGKGDYVGGLVGYNYSFISNSYATGSVTGEGDSVGGLVGYSSSYLTITNSFYNKETSGQTNGVGNGDVSGVTGLTTAQMSYGQIFKSASWDIVVDSSVTSSTPILKYDSVNNKYVWAISPISKSYSLGNNSTTYNGQNQKLSDFYTTTSIFGNNYSFLDGDYKFQVSGSDTTGYKNAGTYNNIKAVSNNDFLNIKDSGNTDGKLTINKKELTASYTVKDKTYDGSKTATINTNSLSGKLGTDTVSISSQKANFTDKNVKGDEESKTVNITDITLSGDDKNNYKLSSTSATSSAKILRKELTASYTVKDKTYDGSKTATINTNSLSGKLGTDTVSISSQKANFTDKNVKGDEESKTVNITDITLSGDDKNNYKVKDTTATAKILKKDIELTAENKNIALGDTLLFTYTTKGLIDGDTLNGDLQTNPNTINSTGEYDIVQGTLNNDNYNINFINGLLVVSPKINNAPSEQIGKVITTIDNKTSTQYNLPKTNAFKNSNLTTTTANKSNNFIASAVETNIHKKLVSLSEIQEQTGSSEVRIPLSENSIITLVNNAVNLPSGVEEQFYINDNKK